jgi:hypothetical protein
MCLGSLIGVLRNRGSKATTFYSEPLPEDRVDNDYNPQGLNTME